MQETKLIWLKYLDIIYLHRNNPKVGFSEFNVFRDDIIKNSHTGDNAKTPKTQLQVSLFSLYFIFSGLI